MTSLRPHRRESTLKIFLLSWLAISTGCVDWQTAQPPIELPAALPCAAGTSCETSNEPPVAETITRGGLEPINAYRQMVGVSAVTESPSLTQDAVLHARYLVKNGISRFGPDMHIEWPNNFWYTVEGHYAASGNVIPAVPYSITTRQAADYWVSEPFQRLTLLDPELREAGIGSYCENRKCAATLIMSTEQPLRIGDTNAYLSQEDSPHTRSPKPLKRALEFPPNNSVVTVTRYTGGDWPAALGSCRGYQLPTGLPITLQLGIGVDLRVAAHELLEDGAPLEHCLYEPAGYLNYNIYEQAWGRRRLKSYGAIVMVPRAALKPGRHYSVKVVAGGSVYSWSFSVGPLMSASGATSQ